MTDLIIRDTKTALSTDVQDRITLALNSWLYAKANKSGSVKTATAYRDTMINFREALQDAGLDLDGDKRAIALIAQGWAGQSAAGREVTASTYNQRLAIVSSFYSYANKQDLLDGNPISRVERRKVQGYAHASPLDYNDLKKKLGKIDRADLTGKRDYAILTLALQTGRRLSELVALKRGDILFNDGKALITWQRAKGGKVMSDRLPIAVTNALVDYLNAAKLLTAPFEAAVWINTSRRNPGAPISIQTVADICQRHLGVTKVHTLRHTFAKAMEDSGAKVSDIQARLGHESLATTGRYLAALKRADNEHADALADLFGITADQPVNVADLETPVPADPPAKVEQPKPASAKKPRKTPTTRKASAGLPDDKPIVIPISNHAAHLLTLFGVKPTFVSRKTTSIYGPSGDGD